MISNPELLSQLRKVLRAEIGDTIWVQSPIDEKTKLRFEVRIDGWDASNIQWTILSEQTYEQAKWTKWMIIAMPNKREKIEMIVQKLTECGMDQILFWPSERSVIRDRNTKKEERLQKIIKEAVEQSRGWKLPKVGFTTKPKEIVWSANLIIFDKGWNPEKWKNEEKPDRPLTLWLYWLIWPEGGFTYKDYQTFEGTKYDIYGLWETVLRTETAAIVWGWLIQNNGL